MHCGNCGDTSSEVRPCHIKAQPDIKLQGDAWICYGCAQKLIPACFKESDFTPWSGHPCDSCRKWAAFDGAIPGMPIGVVCAQCPSPERVGRNWVRRAEREDRGTWLCEPCYEKGHFGHKQKELQPILDRLSRL